MSGVNRVGRFRKARGWLVGLALLCAVVAGASVWFQQRALANTREGAKNRAITYAAQVLAPALAGRALSGPIEGRPGFQLGQLLKKEIFASDDLAERVRVWSRAGELVFSSDPNERLGSSPLGDGAAIRAASKSGGTVATTNVAGTFSVYAPLRIGQRPAGAVEIDNGEAAIEAIARQPWAPLRAVAEGLVAGFSVLLLLSFVPFARLRRERARGKARIDDGSGLAEGSDKAVERLRAKLQKAEVARDSLEQELSQLRTQVAHASEGVERRAAHLEKALEIAEQQLEEAMASPANAVLEAKVKDLESALSAAKTDIVELESRASDVATRNAENQVIAERSQTEAELARSQVGAIEARAAEFASKLEGAERKAADAEGAKAELKERIEKLEEELRWTRAQQVETQPILQEATARAQEEKGRADEMLERATRAEARFADADGRMIELAREVEALRSRVTGSDGSDAVDAGLQEATARAREAELRVAYLESRMAKLLADPGRAETPEGPTAGSGSDSELIEARQHAAQAEERAAQLSARLEQADARIRRAYAEAEAAQARLASATERGDVPADAAETVSLRTEVDRLGTELAHALERTHAAEERGARLEAELVALHRGLEPGEGSAEPVPDGWPPTVAGPGGEGEHGRSGNGSIAQAEGAEEERPSLRARLAETAARKKGRVTGDRSR